MKILHVSSATDVGGAERMLVELARAAPERAQRIAVLAPPGTFDPELRAAGAARLFMPSAGRSPGAVARQALAAARAARRVGPTVIHAHNVKATAVALAARLGSPAPVLATFHGVTPEEFPSAARILGRARRVVCVSDDLAGRLAQAGVTEHRIDVIVNGVSPIPDLSSELRARLDAELGLGKAAGVVAIVGRLAPQKAHERFLLAAREILRVRPGARFLVVGDGERRAELEGLCAELGLTGDVTFLGSRPDARELVARADVLVFSSHWEGLSIAALEGLAAGTPVVSTPVAGMGELLGSGAGVMVEEAEPGALAAAVEEILAGPDAAAAMGRRGRALVEERYGVGRMADAYAAAYGRLASG